MFLLLGREGFGIEDAFNLVDYRMTYATFDDVRIRDGGLSTRLRKKQALGRDPFCWASEFAAILRGDGSPFHVPAVGAPTSLSS